MDQKFRHHDQRSDPDEPDGIRVCCCRLFTCISVHAITRPAGLLKIVQLLLGSLCQTLLLQYGQPDATYIGRAYTGFAETVATSTTVAFVLLVCSVLSSRTYRAVRQSLFVSVGRRTAMCVWDCECQLFVCFYREIPL